MSPGNNRYSTGAGECLDIEYKSREKEIFLYLLLSSADPEKEVEGFGERSR